MAGELPPQQGEDDEADDSMPLEEAAILNFQRTDRHSAPIEEIEAVAEEQGETVEEKYTPGQLEFLERLFGSDTIED